MKTIEELINYLELAKDQFDYEAGSLIQLYNDELWILDTVWENDEPIMIEVCYPDSYIDPIKKWLIKKELTK